MNVKQFDESKAKQELKKCPVIVQEYLKKIEESRDRWKDLYYQAINKLRLSANKDIK